MSSKEKLLEEFELFRGTGGGIEDWFSSRMPERVADALTQCETNPISCEELNQFLILSHEAGVSRGFFRFYFCSNPYSHSVGLPVCVREQTFARWPTFARLRLAPKN
jgi:hypothetical protein